MHMSLEPSFEQVGIENGYNWTLPLEVGRPVSSSLKSVWYVALPLSSAHRGGHSGGGALIPGIGGQEAYRNEGTVYPHAALVEMITYQRECFPDVSWRYLDMSHISWDAMREAIRNDPPDVIACTVYTSTAIWAYIVAAEVKRVNPKAVVVFGNDHAGILHKEILNGKYGRRLVDYICTGNNGPFTMMGLLYFLGGRLAVERVPSLAYRSSSEIINQAASTYPLSKRLIPDYTLIKTELETQYDKAFAVWYAQHYSLKRMVTVGLDSGCTWGMHPKRRCKHCSIQGLTPKTVDVAAAIPTLETIVGNLESNVYAAGDSTFGFSSQQWDGQSSYLNDLAEACSKSPILSKHRFMLCYGLVFEFLQSAELCKGFVRTWNVGLEAFDPKLLKGDSKGINKGPDRVYEALELARNLDYKLYISGILGLPGTTMKLLRSEVDNWLALAEEYSGSITTVSVAAPGIIPGSRMYFDEYTRRPQVRALHGELISCRTLTEIYVRENTEVTLADVEAALGEIGRGVIALGQKNHGMKFGGYMLGGVDQEERAERELLDSLCQALS